MRFVADSAEAVRAYIEAEDIAARAGQTVGSAHLLIALFDFPNRAQVLLRERSIDETRVRAELDDATQSEPRRTMQRLKDRARDIARGADAEEVDCLHVLIAISRLRDSFAYRILQRTGTSLTALRNVAVSYITGNLPRRYRALPKEQPETSPELPLSPPAPPAPAAIPPRPRVVPVVAPLEAQGTIEPLPDRLPIKPSAVPPENKEDSAEAMDTALPLEPVAPLRRRVEVSARGPLRLDDIAPTLAGCGIDLTEQARLGLLDMAIGRERELDALVDVLGKRRANNPVLVGPPGVGKTAIVEGLAVKIARGEREVAHFHDRVVVSLDTGALVAGTSLRGAFSERLGAIKAEVAAAQRQIIIFIDELHTLIGAGTSGEGPQDAANELKAALARGEFPCIGATTGDEFRKYIEKDAALERRFTPIFVEEPNPGEALLILEGGIAPYAEHHKLNYSLESLHAAVFLGHRFVTERKLPDKAFAAVDLAGSRARRRGAKRVERDDVARVVHEWSGVPLDRLMEADVERFANVEATLGKKLVGHRQVLGTVAGAIRRGFAGFNNQRPMGSFLFLGPTGVGKTELVKCLAEFLFGRRDALVRFDMSELAEKHAVARLIGAQPGYIGFEEGGQLTEALRKRPFQIVLFDEVEKAHPDVLNLLLQILDEGRLGDSRGRSVSFANTLVVLTSNLGAEGAGLRQGAIGFAGRPEEQSTAQQQIILEAARQRLPPELWSRLDERLVFLPLSRDEVRRIAALQLDDSSRALHAEREVSLEWDDGVVEFLLENGGYSPQTGARGMRQAIMRHVEGPIAESILAGRLKAAGVARIGVAAGRKGLVVTKVGARHGRPSPVAAAGSGRK